jgi:actin-like ATPase involved in cell morphogenesis
MIRYDSRETRDAVLQSPMKDGVVASYDKLEEVVLAKV